jgi:putative transposase
MEIFLDDIDRETFVDLLKSASRSNGVAVHGMVLMQTHFHFLGTPLSEAALPLAMKEVGEEYCWYFNRKYTRTGHLWEHRYAARAMEDGRQALVCLRYIEHSPVKAKIVDQAEDYRWSSYQVHAWGELSDWLVPHPCYLALGRDARERQLAYRTISSEPIPTAELVRLQRRRV